MKRIYSLFSFIILLVFTTSCSSDDNSSSDFIGDLVGKWGIVSVIDEGIPYELTECDLKYEKMIFHNDGTALEEFGYSSNKGCELESWNHTYKILEGDLYMASTHTNPDDRTELRFRIKKVNKTTLILEQYYIKEGKYPGEYFKDNETTVSTYKRE